jgi:hypothetical protein
VLTHNFGSGLTSIKISVPISLSSRPLADFSPLTKWQGTFGTLLERLSKIPIPIGGTGFIIEILATASEEAYSERAASGSKVPKVPCLRVVRSKNLRQ